MDDLPVWYSGEEWPGPWWGAGWRAWCESYWALAAPVPVKAAHRRRYSRG